MTVNTRIPKPATPTRITGKSLTKASTGVGLETHEIVEKYHSTGTLDLWNRREPRYGDFTGAGELQDCLNRVLEAQDAFDALPSRIRDYVGNDPVRFLELVHDPSRVDELRALGLIPPGEPAPQAGAAAEPEESPE